MYNYLESMEKDIKNYLKDEFEYRYSNCANREELEQELHDDLWIEDSVTGNASGSYTFSSYTAKEFVLDNMDLLNDAVVDFCIDYAEIGEKFINEEWEFFDVIIRCNLLDQAISEVLDDMEEELEERFANMEE